MPDRRPTISPVLDKCPQCNYSLKGLPANHICPECGLEYDERSERYARRVWHGAGLLAGLAAMYLAIIIRDEGLPPYGTNWDKTGFVLVLLLVVVWGLWRGYRSYRRGVVAAVLPGGLFVRDGRGEGKLHPWDTVSSPKVMWSHKSVTLDRSDSMLSVIVLSVFKSRADAERLVKQIQERLPAVEPHEEVPSESPDEAYARWCAEQGFKRVE